MKPVTMMVAGILACGLAAGTAWAGYKNTWTMTLNTSSRYATGALSDIRAQSDDSYIYCQAYGNTGTGGMSCYGGIGTLGSQTYFSCSSTSPGLVSAAQSISGDSYVYVAWDASGTCTYLQVLKGSPVAPKQP